MTVADVELIFEVDELSEHAIETIYERHDALVEDHKSITLLTVTAPGSTPLAAAKAVIKDLESSAGVTVARCYEDLVSRHDIADRCGVTTQAVGNWIRGDRKGLHRFPAPFNHVSGGVWLWGEVNDWLRRSGFSADEIQHPCREDYALINREIRELRAHAVSVEISLDPPSQCRDLHQKSHHQAQHGSGRVVRETVLTGGSTSRRT
ncbi:hypothetical protein [Saccharomonospora halophila]|uniref:hypothetical protein n=1 Tax=Saccharomonospora halophila TaxID=129922 RepID=UPI0012FAB76B|nr:hypothetical protein [Saccharomonospora halophila]